MATSQGISPSRLSQDTRFIPQQDSPRAEVAKMFKAAVALARLHPFLLSARLCSASSREPVNSQSQGVIYQRESQPE